MTYDIANIPEAEGRIVDLGEQMEDALIDTLPLLEELLESNLGANLDSKANRRCRKLLWQRIVDIRLLLIQTGALPLK